MILTIIDDLFFEAKIRTVAEKLGVPLLIVKRKEDLPDFAGFSKLIVDLNFRRFDLMEYLSGIKGIYVIGYLSHVQTDLKKEAGKYCNLILARSEFSERLPELLKLK